MGAQLVDFTIETAIGDERHASLAILEFPSLGSSKLSAAARSEDKELDPSSGFQMEGAAHVQSGK